MADMLVALHKNMGFLEDPRFVGAFDPVVETEQEESLAWRLHTLCWAAQHALHVPGDFVECGVYRGFSSAVVARFVDFGACDRTWFLYDAFGDTGSAAPAAASAAALSSKADFVKAAARFATFPNMRIVQGLVPQIFESAVPETISYLHLDLNAADAELGALEILFDRVSPGGIVVLDDYGWLSYRAQKLAEDKFMAARDYSILELPTGQGLVFKR
jgi:hypothetical protein